MKRVIHLLILLILSSCFSTTKDDNEAEIRDAISRQLREYPSSTLQDIYKSFYQDESGPGHLIQDTASAYAYLNYELEEMQSRGRREAEACGAARHFVRVPLDLVKDGLVDKEQYFKAFLNSASSFSTPDPGIWEKDWNNILHVVEKMDLDLPGFSADKEKLGEMLSRGEAMVHHSEAYTKAYDPHYRIMTVEEYRRLIRRE